MCPCFGMHRLIPHATETFLTGIVAGAVVHIPFSHKTKLISDKSHFKIHTIY